MKITFVSNYINHHQIPLAEALYKKLGNNYCFVQTEPMEEERIAMGWNSKTGHLPYLKKYYEEKEVCQSLIEESHIVVFGGTDDESYIQTRLKSKKPILRYSERLYKEGQWKAISPRGLWKKYWDHTQYRRQGVYLLCAGAYVASDFQIIKAYPHKMIKWGYFPPFYPQYVDKLMEKKNKSTIPRLLWAGRFIDWKHPEEAIYLAEYLKEKKIPFHLVLAGGGELEADLEKMIQDKSLQKEVEMTGFLPPEVIREEMEKADIFLFTSDYKEGWGAVLNEAMNSGCGIVANLAIGSAPFLIQEGTNGLLYENGNRKEFIEKVCSLLENRHFCQNLGKEAYETIATTWNAENAAVTFLNLCQQIRKGDIIEYSSKGPGSKALPISPRKMKKVCLLRRK